MNWDFYIKQLNIDGNTQRERIINRFKRNINNKSCINPAYKEVKINDVDSKLIVNSGSSTKIKSIVSLCGDSFYKGDIVDFANSKWIILTADSDDEIYIDGSMRECNYQLKWQNESGDIIQRWIITQSSSDTGLKENSVIQIGVDELKLIIPYDSDTVKLRKDKRLFIDNYTVSPTPYKIISVNNTEYVKDGHGYIEMIVKETQKNLNTDRPDLMLCDYISPTTPDTNETTDLSYSKITYKGEPEIKLGGNAKSFTVTFYDKDDNVLTNLIPKWSIISNFDGVILNNTDDVNVITLEINGDYSLIGKTFVLQVSDDVNENISSIEILITSLL